MSIYPLVAVKDAFVTQTTPLTSVPFRYPQMKARMSTQA